MPEQINTKSPLSAYQFAELKEVSPTAVYKAITAGKITVIPMGARNYIDWEENKNVEFPNKDRFVKKPVNK